MPKTEEMGWRVLGGLAAVGAGIAARKAIETLWKVSTGKEPPSNPEHPDVQLMEALGWAVASGAVIGIARMLAARAAAERWRKKTGHLPPGLREVA